MQKNKKQKNKKKTESILENETYKILFDFEIQMNPLI